MEKTENHNQMIAKMIGKIQERVPVEMVILFGSRAMGTAGEHSDYDLVIVAHFKEPFLERGQWISHLSPPIPLDLFCYTPTEFEHMFSSFQLTAIDAIGFGIPLVGEACFQKYRARYQELERQGMHRVENALVPPGVSL